jgi:hypothetical protein
MFIERSAGRIRTVRTLFVLLAVVPCAALCGWAVLRHSVGHRQAVEGRFARLLGLPVRIERVEHPRPGALRLRGCVLCAPAGEPVVAVPVVDVESSATEVRVRLERVACTPQLARVLAALAQDWLRQPSRFPLDVVLDVGEVSWATGGVATHSSESGSAGVDDVAGRPARVRVECVAGNGSRAVRVSRSEPVDPTVAIDEVRLIATAAPDSAAAQDGADVRLEAAGTIARPMPVAILTAFARLGADSLAAGADAIASGRFDSRREAGLWTGSADGRIERIDLAAVAARLPHRMTGEATLVVGRLDWVRGRITSCDGRFSAGRGTVEQRLLDTLVTAIGCRPGPAYRGPLGETVRDFDEAGAQLRIGAAGVDIRGDPGRATALAVTKGLAVVEEPPAAVPLGRVAWLLSPPSAMPVPASPATAWLLGIFSDDIVAGEPGRPGGGRGAAEQAGRPARRSDF